MLQLSKSRSSSEYHQDSSYEINKSFFAEGKLRNLMPISQITYKVDKTNKRNYITASRTKLPPAASINYTTHQIDLCCYNKKLVFAS
jgi:hypothetical protein